MAKIKGLLTTSDPLPIDEFYKLINGLREDKLYVWELVCCIAFSTALRISDVFSLTWNDILDKDQLIKIEKKTKKTRLIPLNSSVQAKISELYTLLDKPAKDNLIALNPDTEKSYTSQHFNDLLKTFRVKYRLPIKNFSTHTFRKTFGRYVYESSGKSAESLILLNSIFKHSSLEVTKIYIGLTQTEVNKVFGGIRF